MRKCALLVLLALPSLSIDMSAQGAGAADPAPTGTAVIRGIVTDLVSAQPIARAVVKLGFQGPGVQKREAVTDDMGTYVFAALPPGSYALIAEPPPSTTTHVSRRFGQSAAFDPLRHTSIVRSIQLSSDDNFTANIELPRALTVSGRVVDRDGQPVRNIRILLRDGNDSVAAPQQLVRTDSDGRFRFIGVRADRYRVCAVPETNLVLARTEGRFEGEQPLETCYPGTPPANDQLMTVSATDVSDLEIALRYGLVYTIAGSLVDSTGAPLTSGPSLTRRDGPPVASIDIKHNGTQFVIRGVPPGEYLLTARRMAPDRTIDEVGFASARVAAADVENVVVRTASAVSIVGRVEFAEGSPAVRPKTTVNTVGERYRRPGPFVNVSHVREDLTFQLDGLFGPQMLQVFGTMGPWTVKEIKYRGEDIYGKSVEFRNSTDPNDLVVVLTNRSASVTAKLRPSAGHGSPDTTVVLIPLDPATGTPLENAAFRPIDADARFGLPVVRPGDYLIAAVAPEDVGQWQASVVRRLARIAQRVTLAPGEHRVVELDLVRPD